MWVNHRNNSFFLKDFIIVSKVIFTIWAKLPKLTTMKREMTRNYLTKVADRGVKWAFIIGQTTEDTQVSKIFLMNSRELYNKHNYLL